jgi:hypothetical protein
MKATARVILCLLAAGAVFSLAFFLEDAQSTSHEIEWRKALATTQCSRVVKDGHVEFLGANSRGYVFDCLRPDGTEARTIVYLKPSI